jgi:hypothetical protein
MRVDLYNGKYFSVLYYDVAVQAAIFGPFVEPLLHIDKSNETCSVVQSLLSQIF